ncbi:hypothetical protein NQZ68_018098 [Dissostichus eleginoides]|nr:hypothetical protein NQZ68_018098 [Dissostichus eleginoides]
MALDSPSSNDSLLHQRLPMEMECLISRPGSLIFLSFYITSTLLILPICIFVLYLGFQRWRQRSLTSSTTSHSDIFTFHMVLMELVDYSGFTLYIMSVLCVLIRPGPGEQGGDRKIVAQLKRRAFFTIVAILAVMLVNCCANLMWFVSAVSGETICEMAVADNWLSLPGSLVLPLLFLQRAGK